MKRLIAKREILYQGRMYEPGETLPAQDSTMVAAWQSAGSAEWTGTEAEAEKAAQSNQEGRQDGENSQGGQESGQAENGTEGGAEPPVDQETEPEMAEGHLDADDLMTWKKDELEKLAKEMGVEIPRGASKTLIVERLAAETVKYPVTENDGGAQ